MEGAYQQSVFRNGLDEFSLAKPTLQHLAYIRHEIASSNAARDKHKYVIIGISVHRDFTVEDKYQNHNDCRQHKKIRLENLVAFLFQNATESIEQQRDKRDVEAERQTHRIECVV
jgi:hypothetical protein